MLKTELYIHNQMCLPVTEKAFKFELKISLTIWTTYDTTTCIN